MSSKIFQALLIVALLATGSFDGRAQQVITVERSKVLAQLGSVIWKPTPQEIPVRQGVGDLVEVRQDGAAAMRLHFKVKTPTAMPTWMVEILDRDQHVIASYTPAALETSFWTTEVTGDRVQVRVISVQPGGPEQVQVDGVAVVKVPMIPQAIVGVDEREPIVHPNVPDEIKNLGKAVARIRFISDDGKQYVCSGFLVSSELFMTNEHCPKSPREVSSALIDFDYDTANVTPKVTTFKKLEISDVPLDFAIFRLSWTFPNRTPLQLEATIPQPDQLFWLIQHPAGEPKQLSRTDCRAVGISIPGVTSARTDFGHRCDTLGGSSGSMVLNRQTKKVIGLHHLGFEPTDPCIVNITNQCLVNRAVLMDQIIAFIKRNRPDIATEIGLMP